jgi:hypothetical protein
MTNQTTAAELVTPEIIQSFAIAYEEKYALHESTTNRIRRIRAGIEAIIPMLAIKSAPPITQRLGDALRSAVNSLAGYRRESNDDQPCDAEKDAMKLLAELDASPATIGDSKNAPTSEARSAEPVALAAVQPDFCDWPFRATTAASEIMTLLGHTQSPSKEPGADTLRDKVAQIIGKLLDAPEPADNTPKHGQRMRWTNINGDVYEGSIDITMYFYFARGGRILLSPHEYSQLEPLAPEEGK